MKLDIYNFDEFIKINNCPQITNPIYLDTSKHPTSDGLFSNELFGLPGSYDRKTIVGYIDLHRHFFHPVIYNALVRMDKRIQNAVEGSKYYKIVNGELIEDEEHGETGISFLYHNWEKLNYSKTNSRQRNDRIELLRNLKKNEIFCDKWLVLPPFYRDLDFSQSSTGKINKDAINDLYVRLINLCTTLSNTAGINFMGNITEFKVQNTLLEIYLYLTKPLAKKNGYIRKNLMGKSVDYSYRSVISAPDIGKSNTYKNEKIDFVHTGIPLAEACVLFLPFLIKEIRDFMKDQFSNKLYMNTSSNKKIFLKNPMDDYTDDKIQKIIQLYLSSSEHRFDTLQVNTEEGYKNIRFFYNDLKRDFTITDLLYINAYKITEKKHVYITRYPVESHCVQL